MATIRRAVIVLAPLVMLAATICRGQEAFRSTWTLQDRHHDLRPQLADSIIERYNEWRTADDPGATTVRLDDRVRISVITEVSPGGAASNRLERLYLGPIVVENDFTFLSDSIVDSLIRRNYFWRDETVEALGGSFTAAQNNAAEEAEAGRRYGLAFAAVERRPRIRLGLDESSIHLGGTIQPWVGIGFEEIALPDFTFGRARAGVIYEQMKIWTELPLPVGTVGNPVLARGLESSFGFGLAFETDMVGGALSISDVSQRIGSPAVDGDTAYILDRAAILYWKAPIGSIPFLNGFLRLKIGGGWVQVMPLHTSAEGTLLPGTSIDLPKLLVRAEFASLGADDELRRAATLELFGTSVVASYLEQFDRAFGVRVSFSAHGLTGSREPYLPAFSFTISPILSIW